MDGSINKAIIIAGLALLSACYLAGLELYSYALQHRFTPLFADSGRRPVVPGLGHPGE